MKSNILLQANCKTFQIFIALETRIVTQEQKKRGSERRLEGMRKETKQGYEQRWEEEEEKKRYDG